MQLSIPSFLQRSRGCLSVDFQRLPVCAFQSFFLSFFLATAFTLLVHFQTWNSSPKHCRRRRRLRLASLKKSEREGQRPCCVVYHEKKQKGEHMNVLFRSFFFFFYFFTPTWVCSDAIVPTQGLAETFGLLLPRSSPTFFLQGSV